MLSPSGVSAIACTFPAAEVRAVGSFYGLRANPELSHHLSPVTGGVEDQATWILSWKTREAAGSEAYYLVEAPDGRSCATVRLDDIEAETLTWESLILDKNKPATAASDVAISVYDIGFGDLNCRLCPFDVRLEMTGAIEFHRRRGAVEYNRNDLDVPMRYDPKTFLRKQAAIGGDNAKCQRVKST